MGGTTQLLLFAAPSSGEPIVFVLLVLLLVGDRHVGCDPLVREEEVDWQVPQGHESIAGAGADVALAGGVRLLIET